jgi:hypothetical protein
MRNSTSEVREKEKNQRRNRMEKVEGIKIKRNKENIKWIFLGIEKSIHLLKFSWVVFGGFCVCVCSPLYTLLWRFCGSNKIFEAFRAIAWRMKTLKG